MAEAKRAAGNSHHVVWSASVDPSVVTCVAEPVAADHPDAFNIDRLRLPTVTIVGSSGEYLSISNGLKRIRLDLVEGSLLQGPVRLRYQMAGFVDVEPQLLTLQRLLAIRRLGRFAAGLHPRETRAERWVMMLRAHDLSLAGASQREISTALFGPDASREWRTRSDFLRLRIQRLLRDANGLIHGGYLDLVRGSTGTRSNPSR